MKCNKCNKEFQSDKRGLKRYCSLKCRNTTNVQNRRHKLKKMAIEYKGGACQVCGYKNSVYALQFHHVDPSQKDFGIGGDGSTRSWEKIKVELDKCVLLCANCHAEEHEKLDNSAVQANLVEALV